MKQPAACLTVLALLLATIAFAGPATQARTSNDAGTAARAEAVWRDEGFATLVLPSTSPAYTLPLARKVHAWRAVLEYH